MVSFMRCILADSGQARMTESGGGINTFYI